MIRLPKRADDGRQRPNPRLPDIPARRWFQEKRSATTVMATGCIAPAPILQQAKRDHRGHRPCEAGEHRKQPETQRDADHQHRLAAIDVGELAEHHPSSRSAS